MRAYKIYEILGFKRKQNPKEAMDLGLKLFSIIGMSVGSHLPESTSWVLGHDLQIVFKSIADNPGYIPPEHSTMVKYEDVLGKPGYKHLDDLSDSGYDGIKWTNLVLLFKKKIKENLDFERGKDPKTSMGIGRAKILKRIDNWVAGKVRPYYRAIEDGDYRGSIVVIYKSIDSSNDRHVAVIYDPESKYETFSDANSGETAERAWKEAKKVIDLRRYQEESGYWDAAEVSESLNFERGNDPKKTMGIGIYNRVPEFMDFIMKELSWNDPYIEFIPENNNFIYNCLAGGSVIRELREAVEKFGWKNIIKVNKDPDDWASRSYDDGAFRHYYILAFKKNLKESLEFKRNQDPKKVLNLGLLNLDVSQYSKEKLEDYFIKILPLLLPNVDNLKEIISNDYHQYLNHDESEIISEFILEKSRKFGPFKIDFNPYEFYADYIKSLNENINFERGKDPKKALGIGNKDVQWTKEIDKILKQFGFIRHAITEDPESHLHDIAQWNYKNKENLIAILWRHLEEIVSESYTLYGVSIFDPINIDRMSEIRETDFYDKSYWEKTIDYHMKYLRESVNFERGKDPKESIGIGVSANRDKYYKKYQEIIDEISRKFSLLKGPDNFKDEMISLIPLRIIDWYGWGNFHDSFEKELTVEEFIPVIRVIDKYYNKFFKKSH